MEPNTEQGLDHSDAEIDQAELQKLTALMDDDGSMGDVSEANDPEEESPEAQPQNTATESKPATETAPQGQPELVEVEYEGKTHKVPPELKDALLRQSDYTRKTQEVAAQRQTVEQQRAEVQRLAGEATKFVGHYAAVSQIDQQLQQLQRVDWNDLKVTDPIAELQLRQSWHELTQARQNILGQVEQSRNAIRQQEEVQARQFVEQGSRFLAQKIPDWGAEKQKALVDIGLSYEFKPEEMATIADPRMILVLNEVQELRAYKAAAESKQSAVSKQIRAAPPKVVKPQASHDASDAPRNTEALQRLRRSGSDDDAVAALKALMG